MKKFGYKFTYLTIWSSHILGFDRVLFTKTFCDIWQRMIRTDRRSEGTDNLGDLYTVTARKRGRVFKRVALYSKAYSSCPSTLLSGRVGQGVAGWTGLSQCGRSIRAQPSLSKKKAVQIVVINEVIDTK